MGETKRTLNLRAEEHITAIKFASKGVTLQSTAGNTIMTLTGNIRKYWTLRKNWKTRTIKEAAFSEENEHHINGISFKLPNIWKPILQENKAKKTTAKTTTSNWVHKGPPTSMIPYRSATKVNQSETTLKYFDPLRTHKYNTHTHTPCHFRWGLGGA